MKEAARFFRYLVPGATFVLEISLYLFFCSGGPVRKWPALIEHLDLDIADAVAIPFITAGIGYVIFTKKM